MMLAGAAVACGSAAAAPPKSTGATLWTAADIASLGRSLERSGAPYTQVLKGKTYGALILRRAISGSPELHAKLNDFFVILGGQGAIEVGGTVAGEKTVAPDEKRGERLRGGSFYRVKQGDVLFVPADHWLQVFVPRGKVLTAIIIKTQ